MAHQTVLVLLVKDEAAVIQRMLSSAQGVLANYLVLCDTGSTDDTLNIAARMWDKDKIESIFIGNFTNFQHMRNTCNLEVQKFLQRHSATIKWIALADADFTVSPRALQEPTYPVNTIQIHAGIVGHAHNSLNMLIHAAAFPWCMYRLWTHEFLECAYGIPGHYNGFFYVDHADGKSRPKKLTRDVGLLTQWLDQKAVDEPDLKPRALYYLARALEDQGKLEEALVAYEEHAAVQTFTNYQFYGKYRMALVHLKLNHTHKIVERAFLEAHAEHDGYFRAEPLYYMARNARLRDQHNACILYGSAGLSAIQHMDHERMPLFLETAIYEWALQEELAFCLEVKGRKQAASALYRQILDTNPQSLDAESRERVKVEYKRCV